VGVLIGQGLLYELFSVKFEPAAVIRRKKRSSRRGIDPFVAFLSCLCAIFFAS
jgi:hypothetical protein